MLGENKQAYQDTLAQSSPCVHVRDTGVNVHLYRFAVLDEDLLQKHSCHLARFNKGVWDKVSFWSVGTCPTETKTLFFRRAKLNENIALSRYFGLNSSPKGLEACSISFPLADHGK